MNRAGWCSEGADVPFSMVFNQTPDTTIQHQRKLVVRLVHQALELNILLTFDYSIEFGLRENEQIYKGKVKFIFDVFT